jgi:mannonate dehydratase
MMRIAVWGRDLSERYLKQIAQLGADCVDLVRGEDLPGVGEQGYPDLDGVLQIVKRVHAWGLEINRATLPTLGERFMRGLPGAERELEHAQAALRVLGEAGIPLARQRFGGDISPARTPQYRAVHRGGYTSRGESVLLAAEQTTEVGWPEREAWWERFCAAFAALVPVARESGVRLAVHPSDTPYPGTPFDSLGLHRVIDAFPGPGVGLVYCVGTRAEAGGSPLVVDEINYYGRKGRIFEVHLRNVRGSLAAAGGFEEVLLDDGDMNMFKILRELQRAGFDGCLNPDHVPALEGDGQDAGLGLAYSIGYIKALLAALAAMP